MRLQNDFRISTDCQKKSYNRESHFHAFFCFLLIYIREWTLHLAQTLPNEKNVQAASFQQKGKGSNTYASYGQLHFLASLFATSIPQNTWGLNVLFSFYRNIFSIRLVVSSTREIATNDLEFCVLASVSTGELNFLSPFSARQTNTNGETIGNSKIRARHRIPNCVNSYIKLNDLTRNEAAEYRVRPFGCMYVRLIVDITSEPFSNTKTRATFDLCRRVYRNSLRFKRKCEIRNWQTQLAKRARAQPRKEVENHVLTYTWFPPLRRNTLRCQPVNKHAQILFL